MHDAPKRFLALALACVFVAGCAPSSVAPGSGSSPSQAGLPTVTTAPKVLTLARLEEPATIEGFLGQGGTAGGAQDLKDTIHNHLTALDPNDQAVAQLATELPSVDRGTWRVNDDGSMDMTWKLRPDVKWHDGTPFTSADLVFSLALYKDPDLAHAYGAVTRLIASASAPDPTTFVVHWSATYPKALEGLGLTPMPRHLLEETYRTDKDAFLKSSRFTTEFVGLGPYRLVKWEHGTQMELARFDDYFRGRAPFDTIIVRFLFDANVMLANIFAGAVDVLFPPSIDLDAALEAKRRWEGTANTVRIEAVPAIQYLELQFQSQYAKPANAIANPAIRQALYHALNRQAYADTVGQGYAPAADSWYSPRDPIRTEVEGSIPQYPHDINRAQQLLAQASWTRGADGILTQQANGQRFEFEVWANARQGEKPAVVVGEDWKAVGVDARVSTIPPSRATDREYLSQYPGVLLSRLPSKNIPGKGDSRLISSAENRWSGSNRSGYTSARADALLDQLAATIDPHVQVQLLREHVNVLMGDLALYPLAWEVLPVLAVKGVKGDINPYNTGWNIFEWSKE